MDRPRSEGISTPQWVRRGGRHVVGAVPLSVTSRDGDRPWLPVTTTPGTRTGVEGLRALTAGVVGAVLASCRPGHPVGWLLLAQGLVMAISAAAVGYIPYGLVARPGTLPAAHIVARIYPVTIAAVLAAVGFVLLLTPTGSPPSPRWRWWTRVSAVAVAVALVAAMVAPGSLDPLAQYVDGPMDPGVYGGALRVANQLALFIGLLTVLAGAGSLVVRFRHVRGVERQQLQWVAPAAALTGLSMLAAGALIAVDKVNLAAWTSVVGVAFLPLATGAAILRFRLYDLHRIISRTLAYGLLTMLLGLGYAMVVLGLGRLLPQGSSLVVAGATLVVAGAFQPAPPPRPADSRPALQPPPPRRRPDDRGVQRPPAPAGRPGHPDWRGAGGGRGYDAADPGVVVAPATASTVRDRRRRRGLATRLRTQPTANQWTAFPASSSLWPWSCSATLRGNQARLRLPPKAARTKGPPRTRPRRMDQSREAPHSAEGGHQLRTGPPFGGTSCRRIAVRNAIGTDPGHTGV
jgi:hypothetical protein